MEVSKITVYLLLTVSLISNIILELQIKKLKVNDIDNIQIQLDNIADRENLIEDNIEYLNKITKPNISNDLRIRELEQRFNNQGM